MHMEHRFFINNLILSSMVIKQGMISIVISMQICLNTCKAPIINELLIR